MLPIFYLQKQFLFLHIKNYFFSLKKSCEFSFYRQEKSYEFCFYNVESNALGFFFLQCVCVGVCVCVPIKKEFQKFYFCESLFFIYYIFVICQSFIFD